MLLGIDYGASINNTHIFRPELPFNKDGLGKFDALDPVYSNNYQHNSRYAARRLVLYADPEEAAIRRRPTT